MGLPLWLVTGGLLLLPASASGQRRLVHDTLSESTPGVVSCGFCAGERFGVVFRDLPAPLRGLEPEDFPVEIDSLEIAVAGADPADGCSPSRSGGSITAPVALYVGDSVPPDEIDSYPEDGPWPGESLVWSADAPLVLSVADDSDRYSIEFNVLEVRDADGGPLRVEAGAYLRVVVTIPAGEPGTSPSCEGASFESPAAFPPRDTSGEDPADPFRGTQRRSFIYALGIGWVWNSEGSGPVPVIPGNWGVRMSLFTLGPGPGEPDAGPTLADAGVDSADAAVSDSGAMDAAFRDGGAEPAPGGCSCRAGGRAVNDPMALAVGVLLLLVGGRRRG